MVEIHFGNSYSQIKGLSREAFSRLSKLLSYTEDPTAVFFSGGWSRPRKLMTARGEFPTGLIHRVWDFCDKEKIKVDFKSTVVQPESRPKPYKPLHTPWEDQTKAVEKAVLMRRGIIAMPTGTGKSLVITLLTAVLGLRTLIVVPTLELKAQLKKTLQASLGSLKGITVENIDSAALRTAKDYDVLIIDEAHHVAAKTYHKLNKTVWKGIYYRYFFTATPYRNNKNEQILFEAIAGKLIYKLSYKDAISKGYIVPVEAYYVDLPKQESEAVTWNQVYSQLVVNNEARNAITRDLLTNLQACGKATLCLVKEIKHGVLIDPTLPFANGQDEATRGFIDRFNAEKLDVLIGTTGILGEGVDTKPCEYVVIAGLGKAKSAFLQQVGRAVRRHGAKESAKVILFRDKSHKYLLRHFNAQCTILEEEFGVKPVKLDVV